MGYDHSCAVMVTKRVRCWGDAASGTLGYANVLDIGDNELPSTAGPIVLGGYVAK